MTGRVAGLSRPTLGQNRRFGFGGDRQSTGAGVDLQRALDQQAQHHGDRRGALVGGWRRQGIGDRRDQLRHEGAAQGVVKRHGDRRLAADGPHDPLHGRLVEFAAFSLLRQFLDELLGQDDGALAAAEAVEGRDQSPHRAPIQERARRPATAEEFGNHACHLPPSHCCGSLGRRERRCYEYLYISKIFNL